MKTRVLSALVMLAIVAACMPLPLTRLLFFAVAGGLCAYEFSKNVEKLDARCTLWVMFVYLGGHALLCWLDAGLFSYSVCLVFCIYLALFSGVLHSRVSGRGALFTLAGITYPCVLFAILMDISLSPIWWQTLAMGCVSSWLCDTAALVGGTRFGKHKLAPLVSPHKTIEGSLFGAASSVLSALLCWLLYRAFSPIPFWLCLLTAFLASGAGQIGDLAESLLKRMIGVKDFSNLIPGHGGLFDRADALLFSIPTAYFCFLLAGVGA